MARKTDDRPTTPTVTDRDIPSTDDVEAHVVRKGHVHKGHVHKGHVHK